MKFYPFIMKQVHAPFGWEQLIFDKLKDETEWQQNTIQMYGNTINIPRLTAWYGEGTYTYSGIKNVPLPWTKTLLNLKRYVEKETGAKFNSVLLNYYRDGNDYISFHSDDEPELGKNPVIASLSFGDTRKFVLKHKATNERVEFELNAGSLLVMSGNCQEEWEHGVPKQKNAGERINLTFRNIS